MRTILGVLIVICGVLAAYGWLFGDGLDQKLLIGICLFTVADIHIMLSDFIGTLEAVSWKKVQEKEKQKEKNDGKSQNQNSES